MANPHNTIEHQLIYVDRFEKHQCCCSYFIFDGLFKTDFQVLSGI